jgi:hypothetical protein
MAVTHGGRETRSRVEERGGVEGWSRSTRSRKKQRATGSGRRKKESRSVARRIRIKERVGGSGHAASLGARPSLFGRPDCILFEVETLPQFLSSVHG